MRVGLMHPTYWPEVRRGAERLVHDLALWLAAAGHDVQILTTTREPSSAADEDGVRVVRARRPPDRLFQRRGYEDFLGTVPVQAMSAVRADVDVVHAFHPLSAWAALKARRAGGPPVVFSTMGIPTRTYLVGRRYRMQMNLDAAREATSVSVLSGAAAEPFRRYLLREPAVVPPGVRCGDFAVESGRSDEPVIVYAGSPTDPRKRLPLLLEAFAELRRRRPGARLVVAGRPERGEPLALPDGAEQRDGDDTAELARLLAGAHAAVLPAVREAFGLVLVEALAAGTPVVAARSGGCPEIVSDERVGRLFRPDDRDDLVRALDECLELAADPATAPACREHARAWDWESVGPRWEALL